MPYLVLCALHVFFEKNSKKTYTSLGVIEELYRAAREFGYTIHKVQFEGIELGGRRFNFLAFASSQLQEHSIWMFALGRTTTIESIRSWMENFSYFKNVASCAVHMGKCL